jgi:hypothetical protein
MQQQRWYRELCAVGPQSDADFKRGPSDHIANRIEFNHEYFLAYRAG